MPTQLKFATGLSPGMAPEQHARRVTRIYAGPDVIALMGVSCHRRHLSTIASGAVFAMFAGPTARMHLGTVAHPGPRRIFLQNNT